MKKIALAFRDANKAGPYELALRRVGLDPLPFTPAGARSLDEVSGLVLTGGSDVDPAVYGAEPDPETGSPDRARDDYEISLVREALSRDMPVLAICRGMQLFNVAAGGTLIQHLPDTAKHRQKTPGTPVHEVMLEPPLAAIFGVDRMGVNSRHHQAVDRLGGRLVLAARDPADGVIEGFVMPEATFAVAVQWHPEEMPDDPAQNRLFHAFAVAG